MMYFIVPTLILLHYPATGPRNTVLALIAYGFLQYLIWLIGGPSVNEWMF